MGELDTTSMIAFLPTYADWVQQELPHMTLVYAGEIDRLGPQGFNGMLADVFALLQNSGEFSLSPTAIDVFGDEGSRVDVLRLLPTPSLLMQRKFVEKWNASEHKDYAPHITIGPEGSSRLAQLPARVRFDRLCWTWGPKTYTWPLYN